MSSTLVLYTAIVISLRFCVVFVQGDGLVVLIVNQDHPRHVEQSSVLKHTIVHNSDDIFPYKPSVLIASEILKSKLYWTYFPALERLLEEEGSWYLFLEETSHVNMTVLQEILRQLHSTQNVFLGKGLVDKDRTIIHHFAEVIQDKPFLYPDVRCGFLLSRPLLHRTHRKWLSTREKMDFSIDAAYEFSKFVSEELKVPVKNSKAFCLHKKDGCAVWHQPLTQEEHLNIDEYEKRLSELFVAVKTCSELAKDRIPVLRQTWLSSGVNAVLFSDTKDEELLTEAVGVPNTERGHCEKTMTIIRRAANMSHYKWLLLTDDDTLISIPRLVGHLSVYSPDDDITLGERYGYAASQQYGFDYITGGGGIVFSHSLVKRIAHHSGCRCPSIDSPDDMLLGSCLRHMNVPVIHCRRFHQARPQDYPEELLSDLPVSFHKFWMIDPVEEYFRWLTEKTEPKVLNEDGAPLFSIHTDL